MGTSRKERLRAEGLADRMDRTLRRPDEQERARAAVCAMVLARCEREGWRVVAAYVPMRTEPGSIQLLAALTQRDVRVLVPILRSDLDLDWGVWSDGQVGPSFGTDALAVADAVFVPALLVAADGTRLGRGGGSYDRALPRVRSGVPIAALLFDGEFVAELPRARWDVRVTAIVTPSGWQDIEPRPS